LAVHPAAPGAEMWQAQLVARALHQDRLMVLGTPGRPEWARNPCRPRSLHRPTAPQSALGPPMG